MIQYSLKNFNINRQRYHFKKIPRKRWPHFKIPTSGSKGLGFKLRQNTLLHSLLVHALIIHSSAWSFVGYGRRLLCFSLELSHFRLFDAYQSVQRITKLIQQEPVCQIRLSRQLCNLFEKETENLSSIQGKLTKDFMTQS